MSAALILSRVAIGGIKVSEGIHWSGDTSVMWVLTPGARSQCSCKASTSSLLAALVLTILHPSMRSADHPMGIAALQAHIIIAIRYPMDCTVVLWKWPKTRPPEKLHHPDLEEEAPVSEALYPYSYPLPLPLRVGIDLVHCLYPANVPCTP